MTAAAAVGVEEDFRPARERQIRRHDQAPALVALADEAEQQIGAGLVERDIAELVEYHDVEAGELVELASLSRPCCCASTSSVTSSAAVTNRTR